MDVEFEAWVRVRSPGLLRAAYLLTGDQHAAEDLVQTALMRTGVAWRRIESSPDAYVRQVMYRERAAGWRRHRGRERAVPVLPDAGHPDESGVVEDRLAVRAALSELTEAQRRVVVLRFYEDLSEAETAQVLGCSVGTVKSQTHKALRALRTKAPHLIPDSGRELPFNA